jgi:protocatechuate 3,4-dioxygenase beta subunit
MRYPINFRCAEIFVVGGFVIGCASLSAQSSPAVIVDRVAVRIVQQSDVDELQAVRKAMEADASEVQRVLLDPAYAELRDTEAFRDAIRDAVKKHKVNQLTLAPPDEPGEWIEIEGITVDAQQQPIAGVDVYVFGTDQQGHYHPGMSVAEGERKPRLFGMLVSDEAGKFSFRTVRPGPYPGTRNALHFHIMARKGDLRIGAPNYVVFDDDPLLEEPQNVEQRGEALRIEMKGKDAAGVSLGKLVLPMR